MSESKISFRTPKDIAATVARVAVRDFGGNKSKLALQYLRDRFESDGELDAAVEAQGVDEVVALVQELRARGVPVDRINQSLVDLYEEVA